MTRIRNFLLLCVMALSLIACSSAFAAAPTGESGHGGEHEFVGNELIPIQPESQKQAVVQAVWVLIIFTILLAILYPTAWKGVLAALKAREQRIRQDIADAEATRAKAEATLAEYNKQLSTAEDRVREMLAKAQSDAQRLAETIRGSATQEADAIKQKALTDIEGARRLAISQIKQEAAELSTAIAEKIIRRNLNVDDQRELVKQSLSQLEAAGSN